MGLFKKAEKKQLPLAVELVLSMTSDNYQKQEHRFALKTTDRFDFGYDSLKIFNRDGQLIDFFKPQAGYSVHYHVVYGEVEGTRRK